MFDLAVRTMAAHRMTLASAVGVIVMAACADDSPLTLGGDDEVVLCDVDQSLLFSSLPPNAIPALTTPTMVDANDPETDYLFEEDRVLGVVINGQARAYPHPILWHHEIINDEIDGTWIAVTFCPLTGSGLAFDPNLDGQRLDIGVSGLLFANNLVLYDRSSRSVYGPQLGVSALCQDFAGQELALMGEVLLTRPDAYTLFWFAWRHFQPGGSTFGS